MNRVLIKLQERKGMGMMAAVTYFLVFLLLAGFITEGHRLIGTVKNVKDHIRYAVVSAATENAFQVYGGVREGNSTNSRYNGADWQNISLSTADVAGRLNAILKLTESAEGLENASKGRLNFILSDLKVTYVPAILRSNNTDTLNFSVNFHLTVPFYFAGKVVWQYQNNFTIDAAYTPVF